MNKNSVADALRALASNDKKRSKAARLRDVLDDVEAALAAGVSQADVNIELNKNGLEMTLASFRTTLLRLRKQREKSPAKAPVVAPATQPTREKKPAAATPAATQTEPPAKAEEEEVTGIASSNPKDIERIAGSPVDLEALAKLGRKSK